MKKKLFLTAICLLLVLICLAGCANYEQVFKKIDYLYNSDYTKIDITVTVSKELEELTSTFEVTQDADNASTVTFDIQRFATIPESGSLPDTYIQSYKGSATVKDGKVTGVSGVVPKDVQLASVADRGFKFSHKFFTNVKFNGNTLTAKVSKPQYFLGQTNINCKPDTMVVTVGFDDVLNYVRIQYVSTNDLKVVIMYNFAAPQYA